MLTASCTSVRLLPDIFPTPNIAPPYNHLALQRQKQDSPERENLEVTCENCRVYSRAFGGPCGAIGLPPV
ncbi:hypothetical protein BBBOND_0105670 [Babesia bigemina]|uniref:Uncharacterized protein n=1 Tax=Babesia bigemina TaxID=5866 RepID=A0A061D0U7_BABBI|nr:hypothetical protein BBBOND_0105670 [Babesia bigemina]CDR94258.1 hypothetical protein BBBOND_0105670 [Babesia bigemina]|eukprot:XP_012766444.1 hypothetical protein BBBOND_0105670 [Babesia bigemina]